LKTSTHTLLFAACLAIACAALLTAANRSTAHLREANAKADECRNLLNVLGVPHGEKDGAAQLVKAFEANVRAVERNGVAVYEYVPADSGGRVKALCLPFSGPGLWGPVEGFLAFEPDFITIRGVTFHRHEETPGLGGEIASKGFCEQFVGKRIVGPDGSAGLRVRQGGGAAAINEVDGITGATLTCEKVEAMLNAAIGRLSPAGRTSQSKIES
jgi:Na+-transporting NADH:ubiquinone oxidoreductase subunit C